MQETAKESDVRQVISSRSAKDRNREPTDVQCGQMQAWCMCDDPDRRKLLLARFMGLALTRSN